MHGESTQALGPLASQVFYAKTLNWGLGPWYLGIITEVNRPCLHLGTSRRARYHDPLLSPRLLQAVLLKFACNYAKPAGHAWYEHADAQDLVWALMSAYCGLLQHALWSRRSYFKMRNSEVVGLRSLRAPRIASQGQSRRQGLSRGAWLQHGGLPAKALPQNHPWLVL